LAPKGESGKEDNTAVSNAEEGRVRTYRNDGIGDLNIWNRRRKPIRRQKVLNGRRL